MAWLIIRGEPDQSRQVRLEADRLSIGRASDCDLRLADASVSRHHAELVRSGREYTLRDLGATNAVYVNHARVKEQTLRSGDQIQLGRFVVTFEEREPRHPDDDRAASDVHRLDVQHSLQEATSWGSGHGAGELDRQVERFALLYRVGRSVLSAASLDEVNEVALSLLFDCVKAERGALLLRDPANGEMTSRLLRRRDRGTLSLAEFAVPRSIVNEVISSKVALLTSDATNDPRFDAGASVLAASIRSALCVPLWEGDDILGVVYLDSRIENYAFTRDDLILINAIANLIAIRLKQERLNAMLSEERVVRSNLERYHSPDVVDAILAGARKEIEPELGLEEREVTILFADVKGFTLLAERTPPAEVAAFLNEYYDLATRAIFEHGGTVNEYVGDSVMGIFGAPLAHPDHATRAVRTGLDLLRQLAERRSSSPALALGCEVRVGINTGDVVVGSVGSPRRLKYAVVGDPVNVAARLEKLGEPDTIVLGESTYQQLDLDVPCRDLGPTTLRGRQKPIRVYEIRP